MAHPQEISVQQRQRYEHLSPLMRAKARAAKQEVTNACPYGCDLKSLDENGYCRHLVGFTNDGKTYEPMVRENGKRRVRVKMEPVPGEVVTEDGETPMRPRLEDVQPTDQLVRITVSSRVYRDVDGSGERLRKREEEKKRAEREEQRRQLLEDLREDPAIRQQLLDVLSEPAKSEQLVG